jgi:lipoate-protein ligase A
MGKVIQFPKKFNSKSVPISEEERLANIKRYQAELSLNTSIELTYQLFEEIESRGIKLRDKELDQDLLMVCESLKSALLKACGHDHPLQAIVKEVVNKNESEIFATTWENLYKD